MTEAYKCDGCGNLFEKKFQGFNRYMGLPNGSEVRAYLTLNSLFESHWDGEIDLCNSCIAKVFRDYAPLITNELESEPKGGVPS